ncbi:extracellular solute-binding protein [Salipiger sp. PrR002]|uniref:extracellular solute-binding protein n=1 Tax=Salipiger sp. PrR002 TaxID=2706489 RepID=UPI0013B606A4|nr:extracellular solute-binding protein [Salipiger sp. PrR002]NDW00168.1 extracellular solute-binding protein [Salipiger sp. PrR002]NDW56823.1 extracellular solute-binding protein [Salipiger sp. PrR004]
MIRTLATATALCAALSGPALAQDLTDMSWDQIVEQAKAEGEVTWYNWYFEPELRTYAKAFEETYGITVTLPDVSSGDDALNKAIAEQGRDSTDIDVISMPGQWAGRVSLDELLLGPIQPMLPEADAVTSLAEGQDWQGYAVKFWGNQTGIIYDSNRIEAAELPQTLADFETFIAERPGQLGFNLENGGSGPSFIGNISRNVLGLGPDSDAAGMPDMAPVYEWFTERDGEYILTASNADSLSRLNAGEFLLVPGWEDMLAGMIKRGEIGENIKIYVPTLGMNGGGNVVGIPKNAGHPAAALLFISWLTSAEAQTAQNIDFGTAPANTGADDSRSLISNDQRANSRSWIAPLNNDEIVKDVIENAFMY